MGSQRVGPNLATEHHHLFIGAHRPWPTLGGYGSNGSLIVGVCVVLVWDAWLIWCHCSTIYST